MLPRAAAPVVCFLALCHGAAGLVRSLEREVDDRGPCPVVCTPEECGKVDRDDLDRPMVRALQRQPGLDGFCYFTQLGAHWLNRVPWILRTHDMASFLEYCQEFAQRPQGRELPQPEALSYEGAHLTSHLVPRFENSSRFDIQYCHALGWLKGQRLDGVSPQDFEAWQTLGEQECQRIKRLERFHDEDFTFRFHLSKQAKTTRDFRAHVYGNCLLGSVAHEMAWCREAVGCLLPHNYVGHGSECS